MLDNFVRLITECQQEISPEVLKAANEAHRFVPKPECKKCKGVLFTEDGKPCDKCNGTGVEK